MTPISRRKLITTGLAATAGVAGLAAAAKSRDAMDSSRPITAESTAPAKRSPTPRSASSPRTRWPASFRAA